MKSFTTFISSASQSGTRPARRPRRSVLLRSVVIASATALGAIQGSGLQTNGPIATAADCDCWDESCDACGGNGNPMANCLIFKSLDAVAGGIEKALGLDKSCGCDAMGCDDACDAANIHDLMMPMHGQPAPNLAAPVVTSPHVSAPPSAPIDVRPMGPPAYHSPSPAPSGTMPMSPSQPAVPGGPTMGAPGGLDAPAPPSSTAPDVRPPIPKPIPSPVPEPKSNDDGSLFDALDDPFSDDEVRSYRPYRNVRPSGYLQRAGSATSSRRAGAAIRTRVGAPSREASYRTTPPTLQAPVRQTSATSRRPADANESQPIGSGVAEESRRNAPTFRMSSPSSGPIVELQPTNYLPSRR